MPTLVAMQLSSHRYAQDAVLTTEGSELSAGLTVCADSIVQWL